MKNLFIVAAMTTMLCTCVGATIAQQTPEALLGQAPAVPQNVCAMNGDQRSEFLNKVKALSQQLAAEIEKREQQNQAWAEANQSKIEQNALDKAGLTQADLAKLQNNNLSQVEEQAIINKAMQNQYGMSMDDAQKLASMSPKEQEAWAAAQANQMQAQAKANPAAARQTGTQKNSKEMSELTQELQTLVQKLTDKATALQKEFQKLEDDAQNSDLAKEVARLEKEVGRRMGASGSAKEDAEMNQLQSQLKSKQDEYCKTYSNRQVRLVSNYNSFVKTSMPDNYRIEEITKRLTALQTGVDTKSVSNDMTALVSVSNYLGVLENIFKYVTPN